MSLVNELSSILHVGLGFFSLWILMYCCWRPYRVDLVRQNLFSLRDELFDYAKCGKISFDSPAYFLLRRNINGMIRFAHRISFARLFISIAVEKIFPETTHKDFSKEWEDSLDDVNNFIVRGELKEFHSKMSMILFWHLVKCSPVLWIGLPMFIIWNRVATTAYSLKDILSPKLTLLEEQALEAQSLDALQQQ